MRIFSIDVGIKNLALSVVSVKSSIPKCDLTRNSCIIDPKYVSIDYDALVCLDKKNYDWSLKQLLQDFSVYSDKCDYVIVEKQMRRSASMSAIMEKIKFHYATETSKCMVVSPKIKNRIAFSEDLTRELFVSNKASYGNNKNHTKANYKSIVGTRKGKVDDLADAFMMAVAFVVNGCTCGTRMTKSSARQLVKKSKS